MKPIDNRTTDAVQFEAIVVAAAADDLNSQRSHIIRLVPTGLRLFLSRKLRRERENNGQTVTALTTNQLRSIPF